MAATGNHRLILMKRRCSPLFEVTFHSKATSYGVATSWTLFADQLTLLGCILRTKRQMFSRFTLLRARKVLDWSKKLGS
jgi:hypothetical protein